MTQIKNLLGSLNTRQRVYILAAAVLVIGGLYAFTNWRREQDFRPLYSGLAPEDGNAVLQKLRETGTEYRLSDNGTTILVPSERVAEARLQVAGAGLPKSGRVGFELFDKSSFGVTEFTEHINYRRAIEGELERSVLALAEVEHARVHVTFPKDSVFLDARQPAKASVLVKLRPGTRLAPANVLAVCHLVASAVEGLTPDGVSVLDMNGNLLSRPRRSSTIEGEESSEAALDYRRQIEKDLVLKITTTLEPLLGPEKFRAGASVECDFTGGEQSEETYDPARPASRPGSSGAGTARRTENIAYQSSRLVRRTRLPQGTVKRISLSVLLDQEARWEGTGPQAKHIIEPPSPEKVKVIRDLVAAATGLNTQRGDQLIVESLPFEATLSAGQPGAPGWPAAPVPQRPPSWLDQLFQQKKPILLGVAGGVVLLLLLLAAFLFFVVRRKRRAVQLAAELGGGRGIGALEAGDSVQKAEQQLESRLAEHQALRHQKDAEALESLKLPQVATKKSEVLTKHLVETAKKDPVAAAQILRSWLYD
jgi:flagellar M-ring protein FliF